ncbi:thiamine pyrophosphate-binding protein [Nocardiopsis oceani]
MTSGSSEVWGSDVLVDWLTQTGIPYIALNPGASFRGLHDSLVNHADVDAPQMVVCLHDEHAVAVAHGYTKVTGLPMAVALHANVGLMHASMAIFNAWCDRAPVFIIGATGPLDAARRRPWIDWIHTSSDQPAIVRPFTKWDDTPTSLPASLEALARAWDICRTEPQGPTYVVLDSEVQEEPVADVPRLPPIVPGAARDQPAASGASIDRAVELLGSAASPVLLVGTGSRTEDAFAQRVRLAEALGARAITDLKAGSFFPTRHPAHVPGPGVVLGSEGRRALGEADVILALGWTDLAGTLSQVTTSAKVVSATLEPLVLSTWSKDHQGRPEVDVWLTADPDQAAAQLLDRIGSRSSVESVPAEEAPSSEQGMPSERHGEPKSITITQLVRALRSTVAGESVTLTRVPLGWDYAEWPFEHPLDSLGHDGGGGVGSGPGMAVGAALALRGSGRLPIAVLGDGDYLMGVQALWSAAHDDIPLLVVVANNRSYFNDEIHQERVALRRGRDTSRKWVGQRLDDPAPDLAGLARAQGLEGVGPVSDLSELPAALREGVRLLKAGRSAVVDVLTEPGYAAGA